MLKDRVIAKEKKKKPQWGKKKKSPEMAPLLQD